MSSKDYRQFNRNFIGPMLPKKIARSRNIGLYKKTPLPGENLQYRRKPAETWTEISDWRNSRNAVDVKSRVIPKWANKHKIKQIYEEAKRLTRETGISYQVDHIIPLRHKNVCGFHVENNLRIILGKQNQQKSNKFES